MRPAYGHKNVIHKTMELYIEIFFSILLLVTTYFYFYLKNNALPPGPYGLPIVGYLPFLGKNAPKTLTNLGKKYGNVIRIRLGLKNVVVLNDWEAVKEALVKQSTSFSGRPTLFWHSKMISDKGIILSEGPKWKEQRHFSVNILKQFGLGRSSLEVEIMYEVDKITNYLISKAGTPIVITKIFGLLTLNVIWNMVSGNRFTETDEFYCTLKEFLDNLRTPGTCNVVNSFPLLRFLHPKWKQQYQRYINVSNNLKDFLQQEVANHEKSFQENSLKDFIDVYLNEIYLRRDKNGTEVPPYDRDHLMYTILDLFLAGQDSMQTTLSWAILHMATNPNIQRKVQEELDRVVANDSFLSMSSKILAPYTEATLLEIQRHPTLGPLSIPHKTTKDATLMGYKIPKDTMVFSNAYAIHHDDQYWGDSDIFRPERFLDDTGKKIIRHERFIPFSIGPRACMGESLAKLELHLLFTCLLRRFTFETIPGEPKPSTEPISGNIFKPQPFSLIVHPR